MQQNEGPQKVATQVRSTPPLAGPKKRASGAACCAFVYRVLHISAKHAVPRLLRRLNPHGPALGPPAGGTLALGLTSGAAAARPDSAHPRHSHGPSKKLTWSCLGSASRRRSASLTALSTSGLPSCTTGQPSGAGFLKQSLKQGWERKRPAPAARLSVSNHVQLRQTLIRHAAASSNKQQRQTVGARLQRQV